MSEQVKSKQHRITIPKYTLGEELMNSISHGVGAGLHRVAMEQAALLQPLEMAVNR